MSETPSFDFRKLGGPRGRVPWPPTVQAARRFIRALDRVESLPQKQHDPAVLAAVADFCGPALSADALRALPPRPVLGFLDYLADCVEQLNGSLGG